MISPDYHFHSDAPLDLSLPKQDQDMNNIFSSVFPFVSNPISSFIIQQQLFYSIIQQFDMIENGIKESDKEDKKIKKKKSKRKKDRSLGSPVDQRRFEANARERHRVQHLADMFQQLRQKLPIEDEGKISKLSTLKVATSYIRYLSSILKGNDVDIFSSEDRLHFDIREARTLKK